MTLIQAATFASLKLVKTYRVMIAVFKTNVTKTNRAKIIVSELQELFPDSDVNFDLKDCDKILRVENKRQDFKIADVIVLMKKKGHYCEVLND